MEESKSNFLRDLFRTYHNFYLEDLFTDCELRCDAPKATGEVVEDVINEFLVFEKPPPIRVHRFVLAAASKKMRGLLDDTNEFDSVLHLVGFEHANVKAAIDQMYGHLSGEEHRDLGKEVNEVLANLGIQMVKPKPKVLRKATPEEIAKIRAAMMAKKTEDLPKIPIQKIVLAPKKPVKRPAEGEQFINSFSRPLSSLLFFE